jgi:hypothetical protein
MGTMVPKYIHDYGCNAVLLRGGRWYSSAQNVSRETFLSD